MFTFLSNKKQSMSLNKILLTGVLAFTITACSDNDDDTMVIEPEPAPAPVPVDYSYSVTVTNLTYAQPLSPVAAILHGDSQMWMVGSAASEALEKLAEGGDTADFISAETVIASATGEGPIPPGAASTITITTNDRSATHFTSATMLVNTNDAFSGLTGIDISNMAIDESMSWNLNVYDSGTEANTEAMGTMPGPIDGGTGFDAARDDVNFVGYHSGVVSQDDGLTDSVLTQAHRFDNPAIKLTITRTQ